MQTRTFTPATARRTLARVRPLVEEMHRLYRALEKLGELPSPDRPVGSRYWMGVTALHASFRALGRQGVRVADPRRGRVGFRACRAGKTVWLCWQVGEPGLAFWRESTGPGAARMPLDDDGPWEEPGRAGG